MLTKKNSHSSIRTRARARFDSAMAANASLDSLPDDWDEPISEEALEAIDAIVRSATSSSSSSSFADCRRPTFGSAEPHRRRLPQSLASALGHSPISFALSPCPRNRSSHSVSPSSQSMMKLKRPAIKFGGQIVYCRTVTEVERATRELLNVVDAKKRESGGAILGFDIEWRPTFRKGVPPGKAAVMQICGDTSRCYVMHIIHSGIPLILKSFLEDPTCTKVGAGIAGDSRKIFQDYSVSTKSVEDLSNLANCKFGGDPKKWGLASLVEVLISKELKKPSKIRLGNWERAYLSEEQLQYAATDAYVCWYLYEALKGLPDAAKEETVDKIPSL